MSYPKNENQIELFPKVKPYVEYGYEHVFNDGQIDAACSMVIDPGLLNREQRDFISNLETVYLQAYPGSGKTTSLVLKLICMTMNKMNSLPTNLNKGILVLSHTNIAVEQLMSAGYSKAFNYPNFIGTFQRFVDVFLALTFYEWRFDKDERPSIGILPNQTIDLFARLASSNPGLQHLFNSSSYYGRIDGGKGEFNRFVEDFKFDSEFLKNRYTDHQNTGVFAAESIKHSNNYINPNNPSPTAKILNKLRLENHLTFSDCFHIAFCFLETFPDVKKYIQQRFSHVFIDEAQDMDDKQRKLLDTLFLSPESGYKGKIQIIGDTNQAIYSTMQVGGSETSLSEWCANYSMPVVEFSESRRYSNRIAKVASLFAETSHSGVADKPDKPSLFVANLSEHTSETYVSEFNLLVEQIALHHSLNLSNLTVISPKRAFLGGANLNPREAVSMNTRENIAMKEIGLFIDKQEDTARLDLRSNLHNVRYYMYKLTKSRDISVFKEQIGSLTTASLSWAESPIDAILEALDFKDDTEINSENHNPQKTQTYRSGTIHSVKGESIDNVVLIAFSPKGRDQKTIFNKYIKPVVTGEQERRSNCLLYVACSRATNTFSLVISLDEWMTLNDTHKKRFMDYFNVIDTSSSL